VRELAGGLAATGRRVLIWDRPNCGASSVSFTGPTEPALQADTLAALIRQLGLGPAVIAGGSGGSRVSLLTVARNPDIATGLVMWWISGGVFGLMVRGTYYCGGSIEAAWKYGMKRVIELPEWQEVLERNPANRDRFLAMDPQEFIADLERWMAAYAPPVAGQTIPGIPDADIAAAISVRTIVFRSGASDPARRAGHPPGREPGSAFSNTRSQATFTPTNTTAVSSTASIRSGALSNPSRPTMCGWMASITITT
jgi:pimeloyl-ACP methyl ester carboxylesterase